VFAVTIQEPGVSSIVSVRLRGRPVDEAREVAALAPAAIQA